MNTERDELESKIQDLEKNQAKIKDEFKEAEKQLKKELNQQKFKILSNEALKKN